MQNQNIDIYTDGSCIPNPGKGGWAWIAIFSDGKEIQNSGSKQNTTNNYMEISAVLDFLEYFQVNINNPNYILNIYSDSQLVINCSQKLWKRNKNLELWKKYDDVSKNLNIKYTWVKSHSGNKYNELVDCLAKNPK